MATERTQAAGSRGFVFYFDCRFMLGSIGNLFVFGTNRTMVQSIGIGSAYFVVAVGIYAFA